MWAVYQMSVDERQAPELRVQKSSNWDAETR